MTSKIIDEFVSAMREDGCEPRMRAVTRSEAKSGGLKRYSTGKPCKYGHTDERLTSNATCCECLRLAKMEAYFANPQKHRERDNDYKRRNWEKHIEQKRKYYLKTKEITIKRAKEWGTKNPEKIKDCRKKWAANNPDKKAAFRRNRRAKIKNSDGKHTVEDIARIKKMQKNKCAYCKKDVSKKYHVDHIIAIARGGDNWPKNLQILCQKCNNKKSAKDPIQFAQEMGKLI